MVDRFGRSPTSFEKMGIGTLMDVAEGNCVHRQGIKTFDYSRTLTYVIRTGSGVAKNATIDWEKRKNILVAGLVHYVISASASTAAAKVCIVMYHAASGISAIISGGFGLIIGASIITIAEVFGTAIEQDIRADGAIGGESDYDDGTEYIENILSSWISTALPNVIKNKSDKWMNEPINQLRNTVIHKQVHSILTN